MYNHLAIVFCITLSIGSLTIACNNNTPATGEVEMHLNPMGDFFAMPYPNNLLLNAQAQTVDLSKFPNPKNNVLADQIIRLASTQLSGFSVLPVVSISFSGALNLDNLDTNPEAIPSAEPMAFFVNIEPNSAGYGEVTPALATWYADDGNYVVANLLTLTPFNGKLLRPAATYAVIVLRDVGDKDGKLLRQNAALRLALAGDTAANAALADLFAPLKTWLETQAEIKATDIAAATVFNTGDQPRAMRDLVVEALADYDAEIAQPFTLAPNDPGDPDFCFLEGAINFPQFQLGEPPFENDGDGELVRGSNGKLIKQRDEAVRTVFMIPKNQTMPSSGFAYLEYVHGSGGIANQVADRGKVTEVNGPETPWRGPGWIAVQRGFAAGGSAMPISPDRVTGAGDFDYLQITNLGGFRGNFRQGTIEMALKSELLKTLELDASVCPGVDAPGGKIKFDPNKHVTQGQSMGAMYTNVYGAVGDDTQALVPTGAGGYWSMLVFTIDLIPGAGEIVASAVGAAGDEPFNQLHPLMGLFQQYADAVDPIVYAARLTRDQLPGIPSKHIYVPHGRNDVYFSHEIQRALSVAYGIPLAREEYDLTVAPLLKLFYDLDIAGLPLSANLAVGDGSKITAAQVQYLEDPIQKNGHTIAAQREEVKFQYGCFLETFRLSGTPTIPAASDQDELADCP